MEWFNSIFLNEQREWRAGWKVAFFIMMVIILSFPFTLLLKLLPTTFRQIPFAFVFSTLIATWISVKFVDRKPMEYIGLGFSAGFQTIVKEVLLGLFSGALAMFSVALLLWISGAEFSWNTKLDYTKVAGFFLLMIAVGIYEEVQVRGYMLRVLSDGFRFGSMTIEQGFWTAVTFTSILFGFMHFFNPNASWISTLTISLAGFLLVWPIAVTGRMYAAFALHFSWNWFQGGLFGFPVSGQAIENSFIIYKLPENMNLFSGGDFGPEAGLVGIIGMAIAALPFWILYIRQNRTLRIFGSQFM